MTIFFISFQKMSITSNFKGIFLTTWPASRRARRLAYARAERKLPCSHATTNVTDQWTMGDPLVWAKQLHYPFEFAPYDVLCAVGWLWSWKARGLRSAVQQDGHKTWAPDSLPNPSAIHAVHSCPAAAPTDFWSWQGLWRDSQWAFWLDVQYPSRDYF